MLKQAQHRGQQAVILSQVLASNVTLGAEDIVDCELPFFSLALFYLLGASLEGFRDFGKRVRERKSEGRARETEGVGSLRFPSSRFFFPTCF